MADPHGQLPHFRPRLLFGQEAPSIGRSGGSSSAEDELSDSSEEEGTYSTAPNSDSGIMCLRVGLQQHLPHSRMTLTAKSRTVNPKKTVLSTKYVDSSVQYLMNG